MTTSCSPRKKKAKTKNVNDAVVTATRALPSSSLLLSSLDHNLLCYLIGSFLQPKCLDRLRTCCKQLRAIIDNNDANIYKIMAKQKYPAKFLDVEPYEGSYKGLMEDLNAYNGISIKYMTRTFHLPHYEGVKFKLCGVLRNGNHHRHGSSIGIMIEALWRYDPMTYNSLEEMYYIQAIHDMFWKEEVDTANLNQGEEDDDDSTYDSHDEIENDDEDNNDAVHRFLTALSNCTGRYRYNEKRIMYSQLSSIVVSPHQLPTHDGDAIRNKNNIENDVILISFHLPNFNVSPLYRKDDKIDNNAKYDSEEDILQWCRITLQDDTIFVPRDIFLNP